MLDILVIDFDLFVCICNVVRKMNVWTLGDLLWVTEVDLCSYKNVGDVS